MMKNINDTPEPDESDNARAGSISALMDGALSGQDADDALAAAMQPEGRERWQLYHLVGDALRAADLAACPDAALLTGVRAAIRQPALTPEPALPAAARRQAANDGVFRWKLASGLAAVVAVAAIGWNVWGWNNAPLGRELAQAQPQPSVTEPAQVQPTVQPVTPDKDVLASAAATPGAPRPALGSDNGELQMLRDPQLDRLLAAHRRMAAFGGGTSAFLRNATFEEPQR